MADIVIDKRVPKNVHIDKRPTTPVDVEIPVGRAYWGKIVGDIHSQEDLIALIQEFIEKAEMLEDVAKETTSQEIKELIINEGIERANEYAAEIHEIIGDWTI